MVKYRAAVGDIEYEPSDKDNVHLVVNLEVPSGLFSRGRSQVMLGHFPLNRFANYDEVFTFQKALRYARDGGLEVVVAGDLSEKGREKPVLRNARVIDIRDREIGKATTVTQSSHVNMNEELKAMASSVTQDPNIRHPEVDWIVDVHNSGRELSKPYLEVVTKRKGNWYNVLIPTGEYTARELEMLYGIFDHTANKGTSLNVVGQKKGPLISPARIKRVFVSGQ